MKCCNPHVHMGRTRLLLICLLCGTVLMMNTVSAETVPCMQTKEECQQNGSSFISVINNNYLCCGLGFSRTTVGSSCFCTRTALIQNCSVGEELCHTAVTVTVDSQGHMMCCPPGFGLQSQVTSVNGQTLSNCMCTSRLFGPGENNSQFHNAMKRGMGQLARGMLTMAGHMNTMRQRMARVFRNVFRG